MEGEIKSDVSRVIVASERCVAVKKELSAVGRLHQGWDGPERVRGWE